MRSVYEQIAQWYTVQQKSEWSHSKEWHRLIWLINPGQISNQDDLDTREKNQRIELIHRFPDPTESRDSEAKQQHLEILLFTKFSPNTC